MTTDSDLIDFLRRSEIFCDLSVDGLALLIREMRDIAVPANQTLFVRGDPGNEIFLVMDGRMRLSVLSTEGRELSFTHAVRGDLFGEVSVLDGKPRSADATALVATKLKGIPQRTVHRLLSTTPDLSLAIIRLLCARLRDASGHYEAVAFHPIEVRLARLLLEMMPEHPSSPSDSVSLELRVSQSELALLIGSTRQRANAALQSLQKIAAIEREGDRVRYNLNALRSIARM